MSGDESVAVGFDVSAALKAVRDRATGTVYTFVVFDQNDFNTVHVADETRALYPDEATMHEHFGEVHSYVHLDLVEQRLMSEDLFPTAEGVRFVATGMSHLTMVRVYFEDEGLFFAVAPDENIAPLVEAIESAV